MSQRSPKQGHRHDHKESNKFSKDMDPLPPNFLPVFIKNQFCTTIELPTIATVPNVEGKCAIVTGSNTGLGFEASKQLLSLGLSHLVMGVRNVNAGKVAAQTLQAANPSAQIDVWHLDMESYESIDAFVGKCKGELSHIDVAILNAGRAPIDFSVTKATGHEHTIQVNYLSTVKLAVSLLPILEAKTADDWTPRLTIVNSLTGHICKFPNKNERPLLASFDDISITPWNSQERYGVSKLLGQIFFARLADRVPPNKVIINMVDPGLTKGTGLSRDASGVLGVVVKLFLASSARPVNRGAATYINAALQWGRESHGCFLMNCDVSTLSKHFYGQQGEALGDVLWDETLRELGIADIDKTINHFDP